MSRFLSNFCGAAFAATVMLLTAGTVHAVDSAQRLNAQIVGIRAELERTNADIAALKRSDRSVGDDYRLRKKMADAEALARKLTDAETELRGQGAPAVARPRPSDTLAPDVVPEAHDGPVDLEAKADLLSDQARRLSSESQLLARAANQIRARQTLNRRASQFERDPFFGLDASRRTMVFSAPKTKSMGSETAPKSGDAAGDTTLAGAADRGPTTTSSPESAPPAAPVGAPTAAVSLQMRTLLDQQTLSEIRRVEGSGRPLSNAEAMEKASAALKLRAQNLDAQAKSMRAQAKRQ